MIQRTEIEQAKANLAKTVRAAIRLRHSIEADNEVNEKLPAAEKSFDIAVSRGTLPDEQTILALIGEAVSE